ncbi:MAG: ion transporter [Betaproteobacteria bacterium]|jgi:voltage-gated potassium channel|nr:ion transporter [Betaproteobacteria bacterium]
MTEAAPPKSAYQHAQLRVFKILEGDVTEPASRFCEIFIALLVVLNVVAIILESVPDIHEEWGHFFHYFDLFSVGVFSLEYVLRVWSYAQKFADEGGTAWEGRKSYIFSFFGMVDFFSTVPFYLQLLLPGTDLRVLRMFRLLRIFKLSRYNSAMDDMFEAIKSERDSFSSALFLLLISGLLFSSLIYIIEGHDQPEVFPSIPAAMHWFVITIISGWGNVDPVTFPGVILVIITQILAIALAAILTGVVSTAYTTQVSRREALYEMEIREVLADGVVTAEEEAHLRAVQAKYGMSDEQVESIAAQVRAEKEKSTD